MAQATLGAGTKLSISIDGGTTYTQIMKVDGLGATGQTSSEVEVTPLEATSKEYISGMSDGESKTITVFRDKDDAGQNALKAAKDTVAKFKVEFANGEVGTFDMVVLGWSMGEPSGDAALTATATGRMTGDIVWA